MQADQRTCSPSADGQHLFVEGRDPLHGYVGIEVLSYVDAAGVAKS